MLARWPSFLFVSIVVLGAAALSIFGRYPTGGVPVACTLDARKCADGSRVGRVPPQCDFAPCPLGSAPTSSPACTAGECPLEIYSRDSGKTFTYPITDRFTVLLDERRYLKADLSCTPDGIIGAVSNIPAVSPPLSAARFEAVAAGSCVLSNRDFRVSIIVPPLQETATSTSGSAASASSGIRGRIVLGPTCPVEHNPPQPTCEDKPYATFVAIFRASDMAHAVALLRSDASGAFTASLAPGNYVIGAGESNLPRCASVSVAVPAGSYATTTVFCDSGIR